VFESVAPVRDAAALPVASTPSPNVNFRRCIASGSSAVAPM
jgi:hypothetical protein